MIQLINKHIQFVQTRKKLITTIHVTGPFVLHKLIKYKYNFKNINELELNKKYNFDNSTFIYIDDIVPEKKTYEEENRYFGYLEDLKTMNVTPHGQIHCIK